jgi:hypothetical protein
MLKPPSLSQTAFLKSDRMASCIEKEIDSRLPYRIGYPKLPVLPVETTVLRESPDTFFPNFSYRWRDIQDILAKWSIPQSGVFFAYRENCRKDVADSERHPTLVIVSTYEHNCQGDWVKAVSEISAYLLQFGINQTIELVDERVYYESFYTSPILSTDCKLIDGWNSILSEFLTTIEHRDWVAIDALYREFPSRGMQPTVIVNARDANDNIWWDQTLPRLHGLLQENGLELDIVLLFLPGLRFTMAGSDTRPDPIVREDFYEDTIYMVTSCATSGSTGSGTLGGGLKLQSGSSVLELGLTNCHVLKDAFSNHGHSAGPFPPNAEEPYKAVTSPSDCDHEAVIKDIRASLARAKTKCRVKSQRLDYLTEDDPSWEKASNEVKLAESMLQQFRRSAL